MINEKIRKIGSGIADYFLGTKTMRNYKQSENFYREYLADEDLSEQLKSNNRLLYLSQLSGKVVPNFISGAGLGFGIFMGHIPSSILLIGIGEAMRIYSIIDDKRIRRTHKKLERMTKDTYNFNEEITERLKNRDNGGEEWKNSGENEK